MRLAAAFDVDVVAPHAPGSAQAETMSGVRVHRFRYAPVFLERLAYGGGIPHRLHQFPWLALLVLPFVVAQAALAKRLLRRRKHPVIHAHWLIPQGLVAAFLKSTNPQLKIVVTVHGADLFSLDNALVNALRRWVLKRIDCLAVVSRALADRAVELGCDRDNIRILPMGVDLLTRFTPPAQRPAAPIMVFAGRLVPKKGVSFLIEAMPQILAERPDAELLIAGFGPEEAALRERARRLQVDRHIRFIGAFDHEGLPDIYRGARVGVFPFVEATSGDRDGLGLAMIEALGCGLPVVVGDVAGARDAVTHHRSGIVVQPQDPQALASAVVSLLNDEKTCNTLGRQGRADALCHFDWSAVYSRYRQLITGLTEQRQSDAEPSSRIRE
jgi:glycosyltransferase involved in cell wall biosynthesis